MSILVYIVTAIIIGTISHLPSVPTSTIRDQQGILHEYIHNVEIGETNYCVIHMTTETIEKIVTKKIDLATN